MHEYVPYFLTNGVILLPLFFITIKGKNSLYFPYTRIRYDIHFELAPLTITANTAVFSLTPFPIETLYFMMFLRK